MSITYNYFMIKIHLLFVILIFIDGFDV